MEFVKASRKKAKIKIGINGPSGSGKTLGALLIAYGLTGDWSKVAVIDTENESASLYENRGAFNVLNLSAPYSPERYIEAIQLAEKAGFEVLIIDSGTHEWSGIGGYNDITDKLASASYKGNNWAARSATMPRHRKFIDYILQSKIHIIVCNRSKTETVMDEKTRKVSKVGMKEVQDADFEYEMTMVFSVDRDTHLTVVGKDRTELFIDKEPFVITKETGIQIKDWCEKGIELKPEPPLTTVTKPLISEKAFTDGLARYKKAKDNEPDKQIFNKILELYQLSDLQLKVLKDMKIMPTVKEPTKAEETAGDPLIPETVEPESV